jgi:transposase, IS30 family
VPRSYAHLDLDERRRLAKWREARIPVKEIALRLGRDASTLYRELKRNFFRDTELPELDGYHAVAAQDMAERRRAVHRKMVVHSDLKLAVVDRLKAGWSPEQIAGRMKLERHPIRVSHETIYRFAYSKSGLSEELYRHLPEHRRRRRPRTARRHHGVRFSNEVSIALRPDIVGRRTEFGHWEADLVMFRKEFGKTNLASVVERVSRFTLLLKNRDRQSRPVMEALIAGLATLPFAARRSITFDRGTEFTAWAHLQAGLGVQTWFCDPQSPWQKGTVENTNGRLRRYLPRQLDPTAITDRSLRSICDRLNATPRKCLGYRTPAEVFREKMMEAVVSGA